MSELWEVTRLIRSKNAGPWQITIDIMFDDPHQFELTSQGELALPKTYSDMYRVAESDVQVYIHRAALAIKVTLPRPTPAGSLKETDVFGGQFHSPLVRYQVDKVHEPDATQRVG